LKVWSFNFLLFHTAFGRKVFAVLMVYFKRKKKNGEKEKRKNPLKKVDLFA